MSALLACIVVLMSLGDVLLQYLLGDGRWGSCYGNSTFSIELAGENTMNIIAKVVTLLVCTLSVAAGRSSSCTVGTSTKSRGYDAAYARRRKTPPPLAVALPPVIKNLARGSMLKCLADLTGGLVSNT